MRSEYIFKEELRHVLAALSPENRLACEISLTTGLRLGDVLNLRADQIKERVTVRELKTGKNRAVRFPPELLDRMAKLSGKVYVFEHRYDHRRHRTRQAVFKDLKRAAALFKVPVHVSPHSCRKVWAVEQYHRTGDLKKVQKLLNHSSEAVTQLYALADVLTERRVKPGQRQARRN